MALPTPQPRKTAKRKSAATEAAGPNIAARLRELRRAAGLSQEAIGAQGFVSTPGWIKIENGQRLPSEKLLESLAAFLVKEKVIRANQNAALLAELCALKYAAHRSPFLSTLARNYLDSLPLVEIPAAGR